MTEIRQKSAAAVARIRQGGYSQLVIDETLRKMPEQTSRQDRSFFTRLVYETVSHLPEIDRILSEHSRIPLEKIHEPLRSLLETGICQLLYLDEVTAYAAVSETVRLVHKSPMKQLSGYANAVLRAVEREGDPERSSRTVPEWIAHLWEQDYGPETAQYLQRVMAEPRYVCLRVNTQKTTVQKLCGDPELSPRIVRVSRVIPQALYLKSAAGLRDLSSYRQGLFSIQDESSQLAALAVQASAGERILDLCAAPGGKSLVMAQTMHDQGTIDSRDLYESRVKLIRDNARRLGLSCIQAKVSDAAVFEEEDTGGFDAVLADVPCSGLGILRSKPDIALRRRPSDLAQLCHKQQVILDHAARAVKTAGRLVYSTCTLDRAENEDQADAFLKRHPEFVAEDLSSWADVLRRSLPDDLQRQKLPFLNGPYLTVLPELKGRDGFFIARFRRERAD